MIIRDGKRSYSLTEQLDQRFLESVQAELRAARAKHKPINSWHEGYAVILEEVEEFWEEAKRRIPEPERLHEELIQIAAMAVRTAVDCRREDEP